MAARTVEQINQYIIDNLVTGFAAIGITIDPTTWSKRNVLRAICYTVAVSTALLEQLMDVHVQRVETAADRSPAASAKWIQAMMFKFQYNASNPQVIALVDTVPMYPVVDPTLAIITACSVTSSTSNQTVVKVAKGSPFVALSSPEKSSAQGYINIVGVAGINYIVQSLNSDKMMIGADIYYQGQYSAIIQATVIAAINAFFASSAVDKFDGSIEMSDLENIIRAVPGVNDVVLQNVRGRADTDGYAAGIDLVVGSQIITRKWKTIAGYVGQETTTGHTFTDTLNFIVE